MDENYLQLKIEVDPTLSRSETLLDLIGRFSLLKWNKETTGAPVEYLELYNSLMVSMCEIYDKCAKEQTLELDSYNILEDIQKAIEGSSHVSHVDVGNVEQ